MNLELCREQAPWTASGGSEPASSGLAGEEEDTTSSCVGQAGLGWQ